MLHSEAESENLIEKVKKAFDDVDYPKSFITEHECEECFGVRKTFLNKDWKAITPEILEENYDKLPLFSPESFHCFLPAYLIHSLTRFAENNEVCDFTVYTLMVKSKEAEQKTTDWQRRFQYFTKAQLKVVGEFIDMAIETGEYDIFIAELRRGKEVLENFIKPNLENQ